MPKQCPECKSVSEDDISYCGACGSKLPNGLSLIARSPLWQFVAFAAVVTGASLTVLLLMAGHQ